jgi:hypothetical protein
MRPAQQQSTVPTNESVLEGHVLVHEHVRDVVDLVAAGRDAEKVAIGFHGTSLGALIVAMMTGFIPTGRSKGCDGHLYFFPTSHAELNAVGLVPLSEDPKTNDRKGFENASGYARDLSQGVLAAKALGLDISSEIGWRTAMNISEIVDGQDTQGRELLKNAGISERAVLLLDRHLNRIERGFVLLISVSALAEHPHHLGDPGYGDLKLKLPPEGLSLKHLVGIEPLSDEDFNTIEKLHEHYFPGG